MFRLDHRDADARMCSGPLGVERELWEVFLGMVSEIAFEAIIVQPDYSGFIDG